MTESTPSGDVAGADSTADYDPNEDQDAEPTNMAPAGERPSDTDASD